MSAKEEPAIAQEKKIQAELFERMDWINRWLRERKLGRCNRFNTEKQYVQFDLYDAFTFRYDDRPRLQMGGFIDGVNDIELTVFLGQTPTGTTEAEVIHALEVVSEYCRLRLPDKYLEAYEKSAETWEKFSPAATSRKSSRQDGG